MSKSKRACVILPLVSATARARVCVAVDGRGVGLGVDVLRPHGRDLLCWRLRGTSDVHVIVS